MDAPLYGGDDQLLTPDQIYQEGGPTKNTQYCWSSTNRYGWRDLLIKVGNLNRMPRSNWERWKLQHSAARRAR